MQRGGSQMLLRNNGISHINKGDLYEIIRVNSTCWRLEGRL